MIINQNHLDIEPQLDSIDAWSGSTEASSESININTGDTIFYGNEVNSHETILDRVMKPLEDALETIEKNRKAHYLEKLSFIMFVRLLVYYFIMAIESGRLLITKIENSSSDLNLFPVKRSAFFEAFNRFPAEWFFYLFTTLVTSITFISIPELQMLGQLVCVDGSIFPTIISLEWAKYKENQNALKLHLCFELNRMIPIQLLITDAKFSELEALRSMLQAGVTYIADRGYVCFTVLSEIDTLKAYFVIRMRVNLAYSVIENLTVELPESVKHIFLNVTDQRVELVNAEKNPIYRLVTFDVGSEHYLVLTNRLDLTTFQVILLYAYRWQIELIFRFLKRSMNGLHLLSTSKNGVQVYFYMLLCTCLLQLHLKQECVQTYDALNNTEFENKKDNDDTNSDKKASIDNQCKGNQNNPESLSDDHISFDNNNKDINLSSEVYPGLMIDPKLLNGARGSTFLATIGSKLKRYWKIGKHWLCRLRDLLDQPFNITNLDKLGKP